MQAQCNADPTRALAAATAAEPTAPVDDEICRDRIDLRRTPHPLRCNPSSTSFADTVSAKPAGAA